MKDVPSVEVLNRCDNDLDPEGGIEDAMRTIRGAPFAIADRDAVASLNGGKGIDIFAGSRVRKRHPDITKWTTAIHQLTLWIGSPRPGAFSRARRHAAWMEVRSGSGAAAVHKFGRR